MRWSSCLRLTLVLATLSLASTAAVETPALTASDAVRTGRMLTRQFYEGELDTLWSRFTPELREALRGKDGLRGFRQQIGGTAGRETGLVDERVLDWARLMPRLYAPIAVSRSPSASCSNRDIQMATKRVATHGFS